MNSLGRVIGRTPNGLTQRTTCEAQEVANTFIQGDYTVGWGDDVMLRQTDEGKTVAEM
jgi:hypothetical protein